MRGLLPGRGNDVGNLAVDTTQPKWLRLAAAALYLGAQIYFIAAMLNNHGWFEKPAGKTIAVTGVIINILTWGMVTIFGLQVFCSEARSEGRSVAGEIAHALRGTFLFLLLPCLLLTALLIAWGILTHQAAFS